MCFASAFNVSRYARTTKGALPAKLQTESGAGSKVRLMVGETVVTLFRNCFAGQMKKINDVEIAQTHRIA